MTTASFEAGQRWKNKNKTKHPTTIERIQSDYPGWLRPIEKLEASQSPKLSIHVLKRREAAEDTVQRWCLLSATEFMALFHPQGVWKKKTIGILSTGKRILEDPARDLRNLRVPYPQTPHYIWKEWDPEKLTNCWKSHCQFLGTSKTRRQICYTGFCTLVFPGFLATLLWFCQSKNHFLLLFI